ncbi:uncharacterized protein CXorf65 homolog isoform X2 [Xyrauchen texanus]|uniref:uncharacterized protein CXorf65 homolog isoform X2 n=1 Tax=Xyrauchen texanus TaxID=154827 RepID=UPI0022418C8C|nr:uncharacterized protein CXorf65 homolog isoform X2 [Xyrauchen texanus]
MFVYIKHGDNEQFFVNTNCSVVYLLKYIRTRLGLAESDLIDLYDEQGVMKLLFQPQHSYESARALLVSRESFTVCNINRSSDGAYTSVTPLLSSVDSALLETLRSQMDTLERTRLQQLYIVEARRADSDERMSQAPPTKTTKKQRKASQLNGPDKEVQRHTKDRKTRS